MGVIVKILALLLCLASFGRADQTLVILGEPQSGLTDACQGIPLASDSVTYAMNSTSTTVRSGTIDTAGWMGIFVKVTANGSALTDVEFSNTPTASTWQKGYRLVGVGDAPLKPFNRYARFRNASSLTYTAVTVSYLPCNNPNSGQSVTVGGTVTVAGTVTANQGTAGSQNWPVVITSTVSALGISHPAYTLSGPTSINLTNATSVNAMSAVTFGTVGNSTVGFRWRLTGNSTWPDSFHFFAVTSTPILRDNLAPGMHLHLSPSSATDITTTVTIDIDSQVAR